MSLRILQDLEYSMAENPVPDGNRNSVLATKMTRVVLATPDHSAAPAGGRCGRVSNGAQLPQESRLFRGILEGAIPRLVLDVNRKLH